MRGSKIRRLRQSKNMSQQALAAAIGVHVNTVARWERDGIDPRQDALPQIAAALECSIEELIAQAANIACLTSGVRVSRLAALARVLAAYRAQFPSLPQGP